MRLHPQAERFQTLQGDPGVERAQARTGGPDHPEYLLGNQLLRSHHRSTNNAALAIEILGGRMHHQVGTEIEGALQRRSAKTIIDYQQAVVFMSQISQHLDIRDFGKRIRRGFQKQQSRIATNRLLPVVQVLHADKTGVDTEPREVFVEQGRSRAEHRTRADDMIP